MYNLLSLKFLLSIQSFLLLTLSFEDAITTHNNKSNIINNEYNETIIFSMILYSSPYNLPTTFQLCQYQRLSDAITDFMLNLGMHNEQLVPWPIPYQNLWNKICNFIIKKASSNNNIDDVTIDMNHKLWNYLFICREDNQEIRNIHQIPSSYINNFNKYITLYLPDNETFKVYLRQGSNNNTNASSSSITNCVCSKIKCAAEDYGVLVSFISQYLPTYY